MSDFMKVTTPPSGYENTARNNPITPTDTNIQNIIDPTKVTRPDGQAASNAAHDGKYNFSFGSNFEGFLLALKDSPQLAQILSRFILSGMESIVSSGINEDFAAEISQFMQLIKMDEESMLAFLKSQSSSAVKFGGGFFDAIRDIFAKTGSSELKEAILNFAKRFADTASQKHIFSNILQSLNTISQNIPKSHSDPLVNMLKNLYIPAENEELSNEMHKHNLNLLKGEIIPHLKGYVGRTNDLGRNRDLITVLTLNTARFENADVEALRIDLQNLIAYKDFKGKLGHVSGESLDAILLSVLKNEQQGEVNPAMLKLISIISRGMGGEAGTEAKAAFNNIVSAMLLNESVYMPVMHMILPVDVGGRLMFSELWVDPDDESAQNGDGGKGTKILVKFDIKDLGFFDLILYEKDGKLSLQLYYPESLKGADADIKKNIGSIAESNGFSFRNMLVESMSMPKTLTEVFPKIYERKNSVNVII